MNLALEYRPVRFEDVIGQDSPVRLLSGLIKRGQLGRNLLLFGALGSGKTTLVRIYAKALNCARVGPSGSPCNECEYCTRHADGGLFEYDVSGRGGEIEQIRTWVAQHNETPTDYKFRVLFFDEAHALSPDAADSLLKEVEEPKAGVIFCFATTEPSKLRRTLRSRLMQLEVRALSVPDGIALLERVAIKEGIAYDTNALALLTGVKLGFPRDLLIGLEQVADGESRVTLEAVRKIFDIDHTDVLVDYFVALADGDHARQTVVITAWREDETSKLGWMKALLATVYYNDILGQDVVVDALTYSIGSKRSQIIDRFCKRLGLSQPQDLEPYWLEMMTFWLSPVAPIEEVAFHLRIALFHDLVNRKLPSIGNDWRRPSAVNSHSLETIRQPAAAGSQELDHSGHHAADATELDALPQKLADKYLSVEDVRDIINTASFFSQHHGQWFNASFEVRPSQYVSQSEESAVRLIEKFCNDLVDLVHGWTGGSNNGVASIALRERDRDGVFGLVVAHIPQLSRSASERTDRAKALLAWRTDWCRSADADDEHQVEASFAFESKGPAHKFHWDAVLNLCAGLDESGPEDDPDPQGLGVLRQLGIPKRTWRQPSPMRHPLLVFSKMLCARAVEKASQNAMAPLSAFDAKAWKWIRKGWELNEYRDRRKTIEDRGLILRDIARVWRTDEPQRLIEIENATKAWPENPERRLRNWQGWW